MEITDGITVSSTLCDFKLNNYGCCIVGQNKKTELALGIFKTFYPWKLQPSVTSVCTV